MRESRSRRVEDAPLARCVQNAGHANLSAKPFGIRCNCHHRLCRRFEQQAIDGLLVPEGDPRNLGRQGEHHMDVCHGQQVFGTRRQPVARCRSLTFGTVPVLAAVVRDVLMVALGASRHMPAERLCSAGFNGGHHFELRQAVMSLVCLPPCRTILLENVSNLQRWLGQLTGAYPGFSMFSFLSASNGLGVSRMVLVATWV